MVELAARSFRITGILWSRIFNPPLAVRAAIVFFSSSRHMPVRASTAKTGLLIHGCHLGAKGWHNVMWGDARTQRLGRLPHAVRLAWEENASVIAIGTGASEKDGVVEGRYALEYLAKNWERLKEFRAFADFDLDEVRRIIEPRLIPDVKSKSTREELEEAGRLFRKEGCTRIILVSSATHIPRCLRDACTLWDGQPVMGAQRVGESTVKGPQTVSDMGKAASEGDDEEEAEHGWDPVILASPCGTSFTDYTPGDVAIIEPPHRGDDPALTALGLPADGRSLEEAFPEGLPSRPPLLHELVGQMFRLPKGEKSARFRRELDVLLRRYLEEGREQEREPGK